MSYPWEVLGTTSTIGCCYPAHGLSDYVVCVELCELHSEDEGWRV